MYYPRSILLYLNYAFKLFQLLLLENNAIKHGKKPVQTFAIGKISINFTNIIQAFA